MTSANSYKPVVLCILDGWGCREESAHNAIKGAKTPVWDKLLASCPHAIIDASELHVGLPEGQMGNSEVGHMNIGGGRVIMQDLPRIDRAIHDGSLARHSLLAEMAQKLKSSGGACHLMGLLSPGGVHSHQRHMAELAKIMSGAGIPVRIHAFLDGRDTPPQSALEYLAHFESEISGLSNCKIATVSGRYYAMDRDKRWERVEKAYRVLAEGTGEKAASASEAVKQSYANHVTDEFLLPCRIDDYAGMKDGDGILMANFRADRAREILECFLDPDFSPFACNPLRFASVLGMVEYSSKHAAWMPALYPPETLTRMLGEVVSDAGKKQLRIAETEKYAHVTFFFNGGREQEFPGEERILVPSPKVATYDLKPEMSAYEVTEKLVEAVRSETFDLIVVNYANPDMVGHTGIYAAAVKAAEVVDDCLGKLWDAVKEKHGALLITADHGNLEMMEDPDTQQPHTAHTLFKVPVVLAAEGLKGTLNSGKLADIAPTVLELMQLPQPVEMTGRSLIRK